MFNIHFSMHCRYPGQACNTLAAVLACPAEVENALTARPWTLNLA
jgi:hypothetical protein